MTPAPIRLLAVSLIVVGCKFSPAVPSGGIRCSADRACPAPQLCSDMNYCCAPDDLDPKCQRGATDAAADVSAPRKGPWRRLIPGPARLIGWSDACSHGPASVAGERWCAFSKGTDLWVLNVTRAAEMPVACDGSSPYCLALGENFWQADLQDFEVYRSGFRGDLLIFYTDNRQPRATFVGRIHAWRPGWARAAPLTDQNGHHCDARPTGSGVVCEHDATSVEFKFSVGRMATATDVLSPVETLPWARTLGGGLTDSGDHLAYSKPKDARAPSDLYVIETSKLPAAAPPAPVAADADLLHPSPDGSKLFFLRGVTLTGPAVTGTLVMADLPGVTNPIEMAPRVSKGFVIRGGDGSDRGFSAYQDFDGDEGALLLFLDRSKPGVFTNAGRAWWLGTRFSPDVRHAQVQGKQGALDEVRLVATATGTTCSLGTTNRGSVMVPAFTADSRYVLWLEDLEPTTRSGAAFVASTESCGGKRALGKQVSGWVVVPGRGIVFEDDWSAAIGGTLRSLVLDESGVTSRTATVIEDRAEAPFAALAGKPDVVYSVGGPQGGLFLATDPF